MNVRSGSLQFNVCISSAYNAGNLVKKTEVPYFFLVK